MFCTATTSHLPGDPHKPQGKTTPRSHPLPAKVEEGPIPRVGGFPEWDPEKEQGRRVGHQKAGEERDVGPEAGRGEGRVGRRGASVLQGRALTALLSQEHQLEFPQRIPEVSARGHNGAGGAAAAAAHRPLPGGRAEGRPPSPLGPCRAGRRLPGSGAEAEGREEEGGGRAPQTRRGAQRSARTPTAAAAAAEPECASLWRGAGRGETGARLPSAGRADVRACARAPPPAPSWFPSSPGSSRAASMGVWSSQEEADRVPGG